MLISRLASCVVATVLALAVATGAREAIAQQAPERPGNEFCLGCHGNAGFAAPRADRQMRSLFVDKDHKPVVFFVSHFRSDRYYYTVNLPKARGAGKALAPRNGRRSRQTSHS